MVNVWWVYATDDAQQHATTTIPPRAGGKFDALCERAFLAPPGAENCYRTQGVKRFCGRCVLGYCLLEAPTPVWRY